MADNSGILAALMNSKPQPKQGLFGIGQNQGGLLGMLTNPPPPTLLDQARQQYPVLQNYDIGYKNNPGGGQGYMESWPAGEPGSAASPRPSDLPANQFGVENFNPNSRPIDLLGDVASHHLVNVDPRVKQAYQDFTGSLEPWQHNILQQQYQHATQNQGETRSYEAWRDNTGLPAYFRGYTFQQWPDEFNKQAYTPQQTAGLDNVMNYLKGRP